MTRPEEATLLEVGGVVRRFIAWPTERLWIAPLSETTCLVASWRAGIPLDRSTPTKVLHLHALSPRAADNVRTALATLRALDAR